MIRNNQRVFAPNPIVNLEDSNFELNGPVKVMLKNKNCVIVLFYSDNTESLNLADVWQLAGQQSVGGIFAACNLQLNPKIASAFNELNMQNTSMHWVALKSIPFILVYQNGFPVAFYNGERSVNAILDYSLTLACRSDYREYENIYGGIQAEANLRIKNNTIYGDPSNPIRKQSSEYVSDKYIRSYPKSDRPVEISKPEITEAPEVGIVPSGEQNIGEIPSATRVLERPGSSFQG